ncbi:hypothetical protein C8Z91_23725 [Paenibacillus elgii]|uniref:Uncharacterized protein n=1 Tax=Paenibacillus elgii TaxID=189691 RepID=A0A2T6FWY5_9BACL|nr:hypothetical protein C8Z91_23725 [Paenibacillus elgii]
MVERRHCNAIIEWDKDPSHYPTNVWLRDIVVIYGEIIDKKIYGNTWTVLVRITQLIDNSWSTYADVAFIVDEAPWHLLEKGYSFKLWAGRDIATVTIL